MFGLIGNGGAFDGPSSFIAFFVECFQTEKRNIFGEDVEQDIFQHLRREGRAVTPRILVVARAPVNKHALTYDRTSKNAFHFENQKSLVINRKSMPCNTGNAANVLPDTNEPKILNQSPTASVVVP